MPFLSIIVPVYNAELYLEQCLESIVNQKFKDFELIIVNDGSTDSSKEIYNKYITHSNVKVIEKCNGGLVSARKAGVKEAVGQYVGYVDADDVIDEMMYEDLCREAVEQNADVVVCDVFQWSKDKKIPIEQTLPGGVYRGESLTNYIHPNMLYNKSYYKFGFLPAMWNKIYRRELLEKNQMLVDDRIRIGEDAACSYLCLLEAKCISYLKGKYYYYYRQTDSSMCQRWKEENILSTELLLTGLFQSFKTNNYDILQFWYYVSYMLTNQIFDYERECRKTKPKDEAEKKFEKLVKSDCIQDFLKIEKQFAIPFYRRFAIRYVCNGSKIDKMLLRCCVFGRAIIDKYMKKRRNNN